MSPNPWSLAHQLEGDEGNVAAYRHDTDGHEKVRDYRVKSRCPLFVGLSCAVTELCHLIAYSREKVREKGVTAGARELKHHGHILYQY